MTRFSFSCPAAFPAVFAVAFAVAFAAVAAPAQAQAPLPYPKTAKIAHTDDYFGSKISDPYRWLENDRAPETEAWVKAQNKVTFAYLDKIPYRAQLQKRLGQLINYPRYSAPFQKNDTIFFYKNNGLQNQSVLYVQQGLNETPEVLIDPNTLSKDGTARLSGFSLSHSGKYASFNVSKAGSDWQETHVLEIATKQVLPDTIPWVKFSGASWRGEDGFYYSRYPQPAPGTELTAKNENQKVYWHTLGTPSEQDALVYEETAHPDRSMGIGASEDEKWEFLYVSQPGKRGNALFFRPAVPAGDKRDAPFTPIMPNITEDSYGIVDNDGDTFLIQTNSKAPNQKVVKVTAQAPDIKTASVVLPEGKEPLDGVGTAGGKLFVSSLKDVITHVQVFDYAGKKERDITLPAPGTAGGFGGEKNDKFFFYTFTSYNYPPAIFRYDIASGKSTLFRAAQIPKFKPTDYVVRQAFAPSKDGTRVPLFIAHRKGIILNGKNPTLLYGYGGFNISLTPGFSATRLAWLEQGGVYVVANLRGGAEYGEKWHEAGMKNRKQNVFNDCIAAGEWLVKQKYASPQTLALQGGSNGGLLVSAVINQRPDLFRVAIPEVGVMDMLRFQNWTAGKFWTAEYGSSDNQSDFAYLLKYSPLHNIKAGATYPATLISTGDHDDRVVPAHSFKYAATLQEKAAKTRPVLIRIETQSGHGSSNLSKSLAEAADVYAFLFHNLGVSPRFPVQTKNMNEAKK